tara:strand:- start:872 stop:9166 length:8295 start_codon:yes stop_codon:yes gene_type:complete
MNSGPTPSSPDLNELIDQGADDINLYSLGFKKDQVLEARNQKKKPDPSLLDTGLASVDSLSESVSPSPNADVLDWYQGKTILQKQILQDGKVEVAPEGEMFVKPSVKEIQANIPSDVLVNDMPLGEEERSFFGAPVKTDKKRVVAFGRGKDSYERYRGMMEGPAATSLEYMGNARASAKALMLENQASPQEKEIYETLFRAHQKSPKETRFLFDALTDEKLFKAVNENQGYIDLRNGDASKLDEIKSRLKENNYQDDTPMPGAASYTRMGGQSARLKRLGDEEALSSMMAKMADDQQTAIARERRMALEAAYRSANPSPENQEATRPNEGGFKDFAGLINTPSEKQKAWVEKVRSIEEDLFKGGIPVDIDDDGVFGEPSSTAKDRSIDISLMLESALTLVASGVGGLAELAQAPGAEKSLRDFMAGQRVRKESLRSQKTQYSSNLIEDYKFGNLEGDKLFDYLDSMVGSAIESLPFTLAALGVGVVTKSPTASVAAMTYLAGAQAYQESKLDSNFDEFSINGKKLDTRTVDGANMSLKIQSAYTSPEGPNVISDEEGSYMIVDGQRVDLQKGTGQRLGYSFALGIAEGAPEAFGAHALLAITKSISKGGSKIALDSFFQGAFKAGGKGFGIEAAQEATTEFLTIMADSSIKGEYISPSEAAARVIQASGTGAISGGAIGSTMFAAQRASTTYKLGDENQPIWQRMESGFKNLEIIHQNHTIATAANVKFADQEKVEKAARSLEEAKKSESSKPGDIRVLENNLNEAINEMEVSNEALGDIAREVSNSGRPELAATLVELASTAEGLEAAAKNEQFVSAEFGRVALSQQAKKAREQLDLAFDAAREHLDKFNKGNKVAPVKESLQKPLMDLEQDMQYEASELAEKFGKPVEEIQGYLDKVSSTTAYAAMTIGGKIEVYDSLEDYFAAVPTAERLQTKAQYDPKTGTVHLSPEASSFDVIEEMIHDEVNGKGLNFDEMAEELLKSDNEDIRSIAEARKREYSDSQDLNEEIVVGVLREVKGGKYQNQGLKDLASTVASKYGTQRTTAQMEQAGRTSKAVALEYAQTYQNFTRAGLSELGRRVGDEAVDKLLSRKGLTRESAGLSDLIEIANETQKDMGSLQKDARLGWKPEGDMKQAWDAFTSRGLIDENGKLLKDVPVIVMAIDEVGNIEINGMQFKSGVTAEEATINRKYDRFFMASGTKSTASRFQAQLRALMPKGSSTAVVLYKYMKSDAARSNAAFFGESLDQIGDKLKDGTLTYGQVADAFIEAHQLSIAVEKEGRTKKQVSKPNFVQAYSFIDLDGRPRIGQVEAPRKNQIESEIKKLKEELGEDGNPKYEGLKLVEEVVEEQSTSSYRVSSGLSKAWDSVTTGGGVKKRGLSEEDLKTFVDDYIMLMSQQRKGAPQYFSMSIDQRAKFVNATLFKGLVNQDAISDKIRSSKKVETSIESPVGSMAIVEIDKVSKERDIPRNTTEVSQYNYGVSVKEGEIFNFETPLDLNDFGISQESIDRSNRKGQFNNEIVDVFTMKEAQEDRDSAKSSRFMGMPDKPFTMNYTETFTNVKRTKESVNFTGKKFQDGWHFWNWWVLQTGNGKTEALGGWNYTNENGENVRLGKIPLKKDRNTKEVLELEPLYKTWQGRAIERNKRGMAASVQAKEQKRLDYQEAIEALEEKVKDTSYGLGSLEYWVGVSEFGRSSTVEEVEAMSKMSDVIDRANSLETGGKLEWKPRAYNELDTSEFTSVELASSFVNAETLFLGKMRNFHRKYNFLTNKSEAVSHTVEKTDKGWKLGVKLSLPASSASLAEGFKKPFSQEGLTQAVVDLEAGRRYDDSDAKSSRIMPPRFYQLKEERGGYQGSIDFLNTWLVNKYADVIGIQESIEASKGKKVPESQRFSEVEQLMYGRSRKAMDDLEVIMTNAREKMKEFGISHKDLSQFMYALHAQERNEKISKTRPDLDAGSGMETEVANEIISRLDSKEFRELTKMFNDVIADTRKTMLDEGLESQDRLDAWNELYKNYVPLQGFAEDELDLNSNSYPTGGAGMSVYGTKTKAAIGRESEAANVLANIIMQNAITHQWAEKNRTLQSLHELAKKNPMEDVWSVVNQQSPLTRLDENGRQTAMSMMEMEADSRTVAVRIDGKQEFIYFKDAYYAATLNGMTMESSNSFIRMMRAPVGWLRGVFTQWDPNFFVSNFARDLGGALYSAEADLEQGELGGIDSKGFKKELYGSTFKYLKSMLSTNAMGREMDPETQSWVDEWKASGGQTGWSYIEDLKEIESKLSVGADDITKGKALREAIFSKPQQFFGWVEGVNEAFENSIRLSAYVTARKRGASEQKAAVFSKNITVNFNRSGEAGPVLNSIYLFFNAAIQGNLRVYNSLKGVKPAQRPDGSTRKWNERATGAQKIAAGMAGFSGMLTLLNLALSGRDPEDDELWYNKMSEYDKSRNMILCYGQGKDDFLKVPLPYGYGLFNNMGMALAEVSTGNRTPDSALMMLGTTAFTSFSPISFGGIGENPGPFVLRSLSPTVIKPFVEMAENKTFFGSPVTGSQLPFGTPVPNSELSFRAPQKMQEFFEHMNESTGGSQFKSGWADFNPDYSWYLFEYMIGGSGDFILESGEQARNLFEMTRRSANKASEAKDIKGIANGLAHGFGKDGEVKIRYNDVPIVKKIYGEASPFYDVEKFKENQKDVQQLFREIRENKTIKEKGRYNGIQSLNEELKKSDKILKQIRSEVKAARKIENYIDRQNRIFEMYEAQRKIMARFNKKYEQLRGED